MARFNLGLEGQEQDLDEHLLIRSIEYESLADSPLSPLAGRAFNNAVDDTDALSRMNDVLENSDVEDIPESSRQVIQASMESIRARLLGSVQHHKVAVEGFSNQRQLRVAIEQNKGIIASVWDAIVKFFKSIYDWVAGFFGKTKQTSSTNAANINLVKSVSVSKPTDTSNLVRLTIKTNGTKEDHDKAVEITLKAIKDAKAKEEKLKSIPAITSVKEEKETEISKEDHNANIKKQISIITDLYENAEWYTSLETSRLNKYLNITHSNEPIITIEIDEMISGIYRSTDYFYTTAATNIKKLHESLDNLITATSSITNDRHESKVKITTLNSWLVNINNLNGHMDDLVNYTKTANNKSSIGYRLDDAVTDTKVRIFEFREKKSKSSTVKINFNDIEKIIRDLNDLKDIVEKLQYKLPKVIKAFEEIKLEDFKGATPADDPKDPDINSYDIKNLQNLAKDISTTVSKYLSTFIRIINQGDGLVNNLALIIRSINKEKTTAEIKAFEKILVSIKAKEAELIN